MPTDARRHAAPVAPRRVLFILLGAIGDVTRALPLLNRVRSGYPQAEIAWAVEPASAALLLNHPAIDRTIIFERSGGTRAFVRFVRAVRAFDADLTLDLQRHLKSGVISVASGAPLRLGFPRANSREGNWFFNTDAVEPRPHFSSKLEHFLSFADWLGLPAAPVQFALLPTPEEERRVDQLLAGVQRAFVAAYIGASAETKLWFADRVAAVLAALAEDGIDGVLVGGPQDTDFAAQVVAARPGPLVDLVGRTSLRDLIGIFTRAAAAFGGDSGPMHIAAAVGTPLVSLWGATHPARSGPWHADAGVIRGEAPCSPCYAKRCPIGRLCMEQISVERVIAQLRVALAQPPRTRRAFP